MYMLRPTNERGSTKTDWLKSRHSFSFGEYCNPDYMEFGDLRVINDDVIAPKQGFDTHTHDNMEIISIVLDGELEHKDSMGNDTIIKKGEIQKMSAGKGVSHSEFNPAKTKSVHFLQIWIKPNLQNIPPSYQQKKFDKKLLTNQLKLIVSSDGRDDSIIISQDAELYQTLLEADSITTFNVSKNRRVWIQIASGAVTINGQPLITGDGLAIVDEDASITIKGIDTISNVLVFNLQK